MQKQIKQFLVQSFDDDKLDTNEKHDLYQLLLTLDSEDKSFLRNQAFDLARENISLGNEIQKPMKWLEQIVRMIDKSYKNKTADHSAFFSPGDQCRNAIVSLLKNAKLRVDICVFTISDNRITEAIKAAYQRNIETRIITDNDKANDRGSDVYHLREKGLAVRMDSSPNHMHHKFALVDNHLVNGSFNWTRSASDYNHENIIISNQSELINSFDRKFETLWQQFKTDV